jgi:hypothetical protein
MEPQLINGFRICLQRWQTGTMVIYSLFRDLEKKNMLDPICTIRDRHKKRLASKTMVKFCKGDPVLVTGDVNGEIDVYRLNRTPIITLGDETNLDANEQR